MDDKELEEDERNSNMLLDVFCLQSMVYQYLLVKLIDLYW